MENKKLKFTILLFETLTAIAIIFLLCCAMSVEKDADKYIASLLIIIAMFIPTLIITHNAINKGYISEYAKSCILFLLLCIKFVKIGYVLTEGFHNGLDRIMFVDIATDPFIILVLFCLPMLPSSKKENNNA